ncbi:MAG: DUF4349 domain-containing protein [Clostridia bacterium]|nr:DUF4349 domain-containing protein [Clostridia bacterium]
MKNRKTFRLITLAAAVMATLLLLASCSASKDGEEMNDMMVEVNKSEDSAGSTLPSYSEKGEMADSSTSDDSAGGDAGESSEYSPKIIKTATLVAETKDFTNAIAEIETSVKTLGGYIESCNIQNRSYTYSDTVTSTRYANYVLRIPADQLDAFLAEAGELLNVTSSSSNAEDISGEYYDLEARISVLETERELVEKMLSEAKNVDTMITLEERLYDIIYEIESYKTAIKVYDSKVSYSTVTLTVNEVADLTDLNADDSFGTRFVNAVKKSWSNTVAFLEDFIIFLIYAAPVLLVMAVSAVAVAAVVIIIVVIVKKCVRRAKAKKDNA